MSIGVRNVAGVLRWFINVGGLVVGVACVPPRDAPFGLGCFHYGGMVRLSCPVLRLAFVAWLRSVSRVRRITRRLFDMHVCPHNRRSDVAHYAGSRTAGLLLAQYAPLRRINVPCLGEWSVSGMNGVWSGWAEDVAEDV